MTGSAISRANTSTTVATKIPAAIPPSQKASRLTRGRPRVTKTSARPNRIGSVAIITPRVITVVHITGDVTFQGHISWRYWRIRTSDCYPLLKPTRSGRRQTCAIPCQVEEAFAAVGLAFWGHSPHEKDW